MTNTNQLQVITPEEGIVSSYAAGAWVAPDDSARAIHSSINGEQIAVAGNATLNTQAMLDYARTVGGPALRELTFHDRARLLKQLAQHLDAHKDFLTELAFNSGATRADSKIDIDGGIGTVFVFASKARRELPDDTLCTDGDVEQLSRSGTFLGQHIYTSKPGVAVHINAFNFPVWGMLEKLAPALLAGMPAIIKPATSTSYITEACFRLMIDSNIFPPGSFQLIAGGTGALLDQLDFYDSVSFTGSAQTAGQLRANPHLLQNAIPFNAEQDSLNASVLGPDVTTDSAEFELFVTEVVTEMTAKAGQKCTAIRRIIAPADMTGHLTDAVSAALDEIKIGHPASKDTSMGALVSVSQRLSVLQAVGDIATQAELVYGAPELNLSDADAVKGAFISPMLFHCAEPDSASMVHSTEAFGPVATIMPYSDIAHACELLNRGGGSLVASVITTDGQVAREMAVHSASSHGRLYFNNKDSMKESTGHGSPLPHMVHGGPGRAGGSEELGGVRGVKHYMQRTAIQGSPDILRSVTNEFVPGASEYISDIHPFRKTFSELTIGETLHTASRKISLEDIEKFAHFTGDTFYAHMDEQAAKANPFFPGRVAHGYLLLSFAAGLFVDPDPGPVLANTGLLALSFQKPVAAGDSIKVALSVKRKTKRNEDYGEVRWSVRILNQDDEQVASYELLTLNSLQ